MGLRAGIVLALGGALAACADATPRYQIVAVQPPPEDVRARLDAKAEEIAAEPQVEGLPRALSYWLRMRHPEYQVLRASVADPAMARYAADDLGQASPFVCFGDFDGNGLEDAAAIVRDRASNTLKYLAFHQLRVSVNPGDFEDRDYRAYDFGSGEPTANRSYDGLIIACRPPGQYEEVEGRYALVLRSHAIATDFWLYYFDGAHYRSMIIAD